MTEWIDGGLESVLAVARQAGRVAELLDVLWEQDRNDGPPPYVSVSQMRVLYLVDCGDGMRMRTLTRLLGASPPSVSRLVDRLEALGFVERRPSPDSRREVLLYVTSSGRQHLTRVRKRRDQLLLQALAGMPGSQRVALSKGLADLQQAVTEHPMLRHVALGLPPTPRM